MTGVRAFRAPYALAGVALAMAVGFLLAAGCSDDVTDPTYPAEPSLPVGTWFLGIWGSGEDDIFIVGQPGLIYHWNGNAWTKEQSGTAVALTDVWGDESGTVYAVGHRGVILRRGSGGWSAMNSGTDKNLYSVGSFQNRIIVCGHDGIMRELVGNSWVGVPGVAFIRNELSGVPEDTLLVSDDIPLLTAVAHHGVTGSDGSILMSDPQADWLLRRVAGGRNLVTCATTHPQRLSGNFVATDGGGLFQLIMTPDNRLAWDPRQLIVRNAIVYGIYADNGDRIWAVTNDGRIFKIDPDGSDPELLYEDELILFDIWGTSGDNLYAVGVDSRVLHYHDIGEGEFAWEPQDLPQLPETKSRAVEIFDKFGRPVR